MLLFDENLQGFMYNVKISFKSGIWSIVAKLFDRFCHNNSIHFHLFAIIYMRNSKSFLQLVFNKYMKLSATSNDGCDSTRQEHELFQ